MKFGDPYLECDAEESPNCTNSVPENERTWDDHLNTFFVGISSYQHCKKGQPPVYKLDTSFEGETFFDNFNFNTKDTNNTNLFVKWVDRPTAEQMGMIGVNGSKVSRFLCLSKFFLGKNSC